MTSTASPWDGGVFSPASTLWAKLMAWNLSQLEITKLFIQASMEKAIAEIASLSTLAGSNK